MLAREGFRSRWIGALVVSMIIAAQASAQLEVTVTSGVQRPIPAAIVPFGWQGPGSEAPFDVAALVEQDLGNSGYFDPMDRRDMVSRPTQATQLNFQDWRIVDVDIVVIGELIQEGPDRFTIVFQLFDVTRGALLTGFRSPPATAVELRSMSHRVADLIYEEMTGIRGVFDTRIAYITEQRTNPEERYSLIIADSDGENARAMVRSPLPLMSPAWSPDGRQIAYVSFEGQQSAIYVQTVRTGTRQRVSMRAGVNQAPVFSPDGRQLALTLSLTDGNLDVYTLDLSNQVLRRITTSSAIDTEPVWSADGQYLYFTSDRAGSAQIYRVRAEPGERAERISFEGTYNTRARVSPDGERLAVVHRSEGVDRIAVLDPETGFLNVLSRGQLDESPSFAPNGALIIYATRDRDQGVLAAVSTDGRVHQRIASVGGDVREPVWGPFALP
ncbi:MAG TPA: Tol-Pal system beta propeller repeat protein TolB [Gammaproteobacteria bacterium]|nr:Tol-Pal system beta propeller repeat protein TolB [Gammaproteobacteria bacterium]